MSCCGPVPDVGEADELARLVSSKLAAFLNTLRESGFAVGLAEGRDAADRPGQCRDPLRDRYHPDDSKLHQPPEHAVESERHRQQAQQARRHDEP